MPFGLLPGNDRVALKRRPAFAAGGECRSAAFENAQGLDLCLSLLPLKCSRTQVFLLFCQAILQPIDIAIRYSVLWNMCNTITHRQLVPTRYLIRKIIAHMTY